MPDARKRCRALGPALPCPRARAVCALAHSHAVPRGHLADTMRRSRQPCSPSCVVCCLSLPEGVRAAACVCQCAHKHSLTRRERKRERDRERAREKDSDEQRHRHTQLMISMQTLLSPPPPPPYAPLYPRTRPRTADGKQATRATRWQTCAGLVVCTSGTDSVGASPAQHAHATRRHAGSPAEVQSSVPQDVGHWPHVAKSAAARQAECHSLAQGRPNATRLPDASAPPAFLLRVSCCLPSFLLVPLYAPVYARV